MPLFFTELPSQVIQIWQAQQALAKHYERTGLKFTLDGRLIGDIAEAMALDIFDLRLPAKRTKGVDALTAEGRTVQVKASGLKNAGPSFNPGKGVDQQLLFFKFDFAEGTATVEYNGPEAPVRERLLPMQWTGTRTVKLEELLALGRELGEGEALRPVKLR
jgi:hypothetical protein